MSETVKFNKRILVSPLDWGLGHATRCIPVIRHLRKLGADVWIATSGMQETLLRSEFPDANFLHLPGYGVSYGRHGVMLRLLGQLHVIRRHIFTEHAWLQQAVREHGFDGVISDNRYGLYSTEVPSIIITHQLALQIPKWAGFMRAGVQQMLYHHIENFGSCWIPDLTDDIHSLAGNMSHPKKLPEMPVEYIGWLSRFEKPEIPPSREKFILISLSGPEPQREILEEKIMAQLPSIQQPVCLVRGQPGENFLPEVPAHVTVFNHLPAPEMQDLMLRCQLLISRSGYSTLMDAMVLETSMACVATPGQTEQEYLSKRLAAKGWAVTQTQDQFNLPEILKTKPTPFQSLQKESLSGDLEKTLENWLQSLR